MKQLNFFLRY